MSSTIPSLDDELLLPSPQLAAIVGPHPISRRQAVARAHLMAFGPRGPDGYEPDLPLPSPIASLAGQDRVSLFGLAARVILHLA